MSLPREEIDAARTPGIGHFASLPSPLRRRTAPSTRGSMMRGRGGAAMPAPHLVLHAPPSRSRATASALYRIHLHGPQLPWLHRRQPCQSGRRARRGRAAWMAQAFLLLWPNNRWMNARQCSSRAQLVHRWRGQHDGSVGQRDAGTPMARAARSA
ncbi:hypothetical protein SEVIR_5G320900v4 [Setaria viridis]|uniref:Uncharacterized protein n=1 Tax=Setaria viridis TaxID=4556 RepID=A0A4U6UQH8_SETVI|nr:hypothetical protein SEVIR_5G320900v2 [Setaria viridis]